MSKIHYFVIQCESEQGTEKYEEDGYKDESKEENWRKLHSCDSRRNQLFHV
jgi:hypothetical protein